MAIKHPDEFKKLLDQITRKDPEPTMRPEEIAFEVEIMKVLELVGDWMLWLN